MNTPTTDGNDEAIRDWRNEHGRPDFDYLNSLAEEGTIESREKLQSIADDLDVQFSEDTPTNDLIEKIRLAARENEDGNPLMTG